MSRIKIIILILIVVVLSIIFIQNREPIALKFLCGDDSSAFCPQSIPLPLAVWIALFTLTGAISGSLISFLNRYGYQSPGRKSVSFDEEIYSRRGKRQSTPPSRAADSTDISADFADSNSFDTSSSYEAKQEPQSVERSGSNYSYKYRKASERQHNNHDSSPENSEFSESEPNQTQDDEEDWI